MGDHLERKKFLEKKSHNAEKLKGGPFGFFNIHFVAKHQKLKGDPLKEKILQKKSCSAEKH